MVITDIKLQTPYLRRLKAKAIVFASNRNKAFKS